MKLLVSDYDGTFKSNVRNLNINIESINKFMGAGNKFVIATGREFRSIKREINKYDIKYDYLICNSGLIVFDKDDNIVVCNPLLEKDVKFIFNSFGSESELCRTQLYDLHDSTCVVKNILEISAEFSNKESAKKYKEYLEYVRTHIRCQQIGKTLYIGNRITKADAISSIQVIENMDKKDIYTVGNSTNDKEMLEEFNGYKMLSSDKDIWFKGIPTTRQVHTLTKKIIKSTK